MCSEAMISHARQAPPVHVPGPERAANGNGHLSPDAARDLVAASGLVR